MSVDEAKTKLVECPYEKRHHDELIRRLKCHTPHDLESRYLAIMDKWLWFFVSQTDINDTLQAIMEFDDEMGRNEYLDRFYQWLVKEIPSVFHWLKYIDFCLATKSDAEIQKILVWGLSECLYDFVDSEKIWLKLFDYFGNTFQLADDDHGDGTERLWKLHLRRISYPNLHLTEAYNSISSFVSTNFDDSLYNELMLTAQKIYSATQKEQRYYEKYELVIKNDPGNVEVWKEYMENLGKYARNIKQILTVFYRAITTLDHEVQPPIWLTMMYIFYQNDNADYYQLLYDISFKFIKAFPDSCIPYAEYFRSYSITSDYHFYHQGKNRINYLDLMNKSSYNDWKVLALSILSWEGFQEHPDFNSDKTTYFQYALTNNDIFHSVEKLVISIHESRNEIKIATDLVEQLLHTFPQQCELWLYTYDFYKRHSFSYTEMSDLFKAAANNALSLDWPERIFEEQLAFEQVYGTQKSLQTCIVVGDKQMRQVQAKLMKEQEEKQGGEEEEEEEKQQQQQEQSRKKRKYNDNGNHMVNNNEAPRRNREKFKVKVMKLSPTTSESQLQQMFSDCGSIKEIYVYPNGDDNEALLEFEDEKAVFAALTKTYKKLDGAQIVVERSLNSILWVTNFPPSMTEDKLQKLFEKSGKVLSVRMPNQNQSKARRFCYIEFSHPNMARDAIAKLDSITLSDELNGKPYKLVVKVSDKDQVKNKPIFKREVYVSNIDFQLTENDIRNHFITCGDIESVVLPINGEMKSKGNNNSGFGFVVFKSETSVSSALELNGLSIKTNRKIRVEPSKKTPSGGENNKGNDKELAGFNNDTSISLFGVDTTTTKEQLELFIKQTVGDEIKRISLYPNYKAALVEFNLINTCGRATMALETNLFKTEYLKVGTKGDLMSKMNVGSGSKPTSFVPPSLQRRRR